MSGQQRTQHVLGGEVSQQEPETRACGAGQTLTSLSTELTQYSTSATYYNQQPLSNYILLLISIHSMRQLDKPIKEINK